MTMAGRLRRILPPLAMLAGLFLFGVSLLVLGTEATEKGVSVLQPAELATANGTAALVYPVGYYGYRTAHIEVAYNFPTAPGNAYFAGCEDTEALRSGEAPTDPMLQFIALRNWTFVVSSQTAPIRDPYYTVDDAARERGYRYCDPALVFTWDASNGDPTVNQPTVDARYFYAPIDGEQFAMLTFLMAGSALLTLIGGLAWARARWRAAEPPSHDSTVEALRAALDRMGEQLERTRKHLLLGGFFGIFLWYPFLLPWVWQQAARSSDNPLVPWGVALVTFAFLAVLTALWTREFLRLDRELNAWRGRLGELRDREAHLMDTLEHGG